MDTLAIMALIAKGLSIIETVAENPSLVKQAVTSVENIVSKVFSGATVSDEDLNTSEAELDAMLDEFNKPME